MKKEFLQQLIQGLEQYAYANAGNQGDGYLAASIIESDLAAILKKITPSPTNEMHDFLHALADQIENDSIHNNHRRSPSGDVASLIQADLARAIRTSLEQVKKC